MKTILLTAVLCILVYVVWRVLTWLYESSMKLEIADEVFQHSSVLLGDPNDAVTKFLQDNFVIRYRYTVDGVMKSITLYVPVKYRSFVDRNNGVVMYFYNRLRRENYSGSLTFFGPLALPSMYDSCSIIG